MLNSTFGLSRRCRLFTATTIPRPERPAAWLEQTESLTPPAIWSLATNQVGVVGGQKTVTFIPQGGTGYFRLVLE